MEKIRERFGVGYTSIRRALRLLHQEGSSGWLHSASSVSSVLGPHRRAPMTASPGIRQGIAREQSRGAWRPGRDTPGGASAKFSGEVPKGPEIW